MLGIAYRIRLSVCQRRLSKVSPSHIVYSAKGLLLEGWENSGGCFGKVEAGFTSDEPRDPLGHSFESLSRANRGAPLAGVVRQFHPSSVVRSMLAAIRLCSRSLPHVIHDSSPSGQSKINIVSKADADDGDLVSCGGYTSDLITAESVDLATLVVGSWAGLVGVLESLSE